MLAQESKNDNALLTESHKAEEIAFTREIVDRIRFGVWDPCRFLHCAYETFVDTCSYLLGIYPRSHRQHTLL